MHRLTYAEHNLFFKSRRLTHTCSNRNCFNPDHVTILRNSGHSSGSNNPNAKINKDIAREIYLANGTQKEFLPEKVIKLLSNNKSTVFRTFMLLLSDYLKQQIKTHLT